MKRILSIFICVTMLLSVAPAFGAGENVIAGKVVMETDKAVTLSATPTVTADVDKFSNSFGDPVSIFDNIGMVGTPEGASLPSNENRWTDLNTDM